MFCSKIFRRGCEKKAVLELMWNVDRSKHHFNKWIKSANSITYASFVGAQKIAKHSKPFTDEKCIKNSIIKIS